MGDVEPEQMTDVLVERLWREVDRLHQAGIAHRSLRTANIMVEGQTRPLIVDYSFSELGAPPRAIELDVAELLASLACAIGPDRSVSGAMSVIGADGVSPAVPLLQPLALSASTRRAVARQEKLLANTGLRPLPLPADRRTSWLRFAG